MHAYLYTYTHVYLYASTYERTYIHTYTTYIVHNNTYTYKYVRTYIHTEFWWENMKQGDRLEDLDVDVDNIKMDLKEVR
jgi:hypothetical protein